MKNILNIDNGIPTLLSNVDDGTNTLYINDELVPSSEWTGTGYYTFTSGGLTFTIQKIRDDSGNIMLQLIEQSGGTSYRLIKAISSDDKYYSIDDPAETDLADGDYLPFYDTSAGRKKKSLWSNIVDKLKMLFYKKFVSTWTYNIKITSGTNSGQTIYVYTSQGFIILQTSGGNIYFTGAELADYIAWTYAINGLTITLNCANHIPVFVIASDDNISVTFTDTSTPQANYLIETVWWNYEPIPRVAQSCNALPGRGMVRFREYTAGANYNLPTNAWYQILEIHSTDNSYGTQLALGMTTDAAYYRKFANNTWGAWHSIINTWRGIQNNLTSDSTTDSLSAAQGKALANGSARDSTKLPLTGGEMTGELAFANNTWNSVGDDCYMGDKNVAGAVCFKGINGNTTLRLIQRDGISGASITYNGTKITIDTLDPYVAVTVSGRTITFTKQSGGTSAITTQDTTYSIAQYGNTPANLAEFVRNTATGALFSTFKIRDSNNVLGLGADWIKGWIQYQNNYGSQYSVGGVGLASTQNAHLYKIVITGTNPFTVTSREL